MPSGRFWSAVSPGWGSRNLQVVLAGRVAMSVGRAIAAVVTSLYLASIGFSAVEIGAVFVVVTVTSAVLSTVIGILADRLGRKPFLVVVPLVTACGALVYAESRVTALLFVAAALGSFGRGAGAGGGAGNIGPYQPAEQAIVAESVSEGRRADAFGRVAFASTLGGLIGGFLTELVRTVPHMSAAQATAAYRPAFLAAAALSIVAGALGLLLDEPRRRSEGGGERRAKLRWPRRSWPALWRFWVTNTANGAGLGLFGPFVSYWMFRRYGVAPGTIGVLFSLIGIGTLGAALSAARIAQRLGTVRTIVISRVVTGALIVPMVLAPAFWIAGVVYFARMMAQRVGLPLRQSFTQDMADPEERASVAALSSLPGQGAMAGSQAAAGYLFDEVSLSAPFELAALFQVMNAVLYGLFFSVWPPRRAAAGSVAASVARETASPELAAVPAADTPMGVRGSARAGERSEPDRGTGPLDGQGSRRATTRPADLRRGRPRRRARGAG